MIDRFHIRILGMAGALALAFACSARADSYVPQAPPRKVDLTKAQIFEKLGSSIDIHGLSFQDESGQTVTLDKYFNGKKPVILTMVYYDCPNLCTYVLNGLVAGSRGLSWTIGREFEIVSVSINPKETPDLARQKKKSYLAEYNRIGGDLGWHFLTGNEANVKKLANQVGFGYFYDEVNKQYAHSAGIFVLTGNGKISRVLYGIDYPSRDLKLSLIEASEGKVGTILDRVLMYCYQYDPNRKGYALLAMRIVKAGGAFTLFIMAIYMFWFWRRERKLALARAKKEKQDLAA